VNVVGCVSCSFALHKPIIAQWIVSTCFKLHDLRASLGLVYARLLCQQGGYLRLIQDLCAWSCLDANRGLACTRPLPVPCEVDRL
jgi:hypothetical protein